MTIKTTRSTRKSDGRAQHLKTVHAQRKRKTEQRVMRALSVIRDEGEHVTFSLVSQVSGVSRTTLYNTPRLRRVIEQMIAKQGNAHRNMAAVHSADTATIARLRGEVSKLKKKVRWQADMIAVLNDRGPVLRDEDLVDRL